MLFDYTLKICLKFNLLKTKNQNKPGSQKSYENFKREVQLKNLIRTVIG